MAVPKTTETRYRDGSVQARYVIQCMTTQVTPSLHYFLYLKSCCELCYEITGKSTCKQKRDVGMGLLA